MKKTFLAAVAALGTLTSVAHAEIKPVNAVVDAFCTVFTPGLPGQPLGAPQYCISKTFNGTSSYLTITSRTATPGYRAPTFIRLLNNNPHPNSGINPLVRDLVGFTVELSNYALEQRYDVRLVGNPLTPQSITIWKNGRIIVNNARLSPMMTTMSL